MSRRGLSPAYLEPAHRAPIHESPVHWSLPCALCHGAQYTHLECDPSRDACAQYAHPLDASTHSAHRSWAHIPHTHRLSRSDTVDVLDIQSLRCTTELGLERRVSAAYLLSARVSTVESGRLGVLGFIAARCLASSCMAYSGGLFKACVASWKRFGIKTQSSGFLPPASTYFSLSSSTTSFLVTFVLPSSSARPAVATHQSAIASDSMYERVSVHTGARSYVFTIFARMPAWDPTAPALPCLA
ncbi:hypothetical protein K438DRAFT_1963711 [Mycena galopus ATCC 62051]|nr:hypothetical protein K438DRAFT_1963711 [Mycena galopus ATCC 62051]